MPRKYRCSSGSISCISSSTGKNPKATKPTRLGSLNAWTSADFTQYVLDIPSNKLQLWAIIDSDRVKNPVFRQFYQEREVVKEERRMRVDTNPDGKLYENFLT